MGRRSTPRSVWVEDQVLAALNDGPGPTMDIMRRTGLKYGDVYPALMRLCRSDRAGRGRMDPDSGDLRICWCRVRLPLEIPGESLLR